MTDQENAVEFRQTFLSLFPTLFSFANSLVTDKIAVKNIVWTSFILLWNKWTDLDSELNRKAFLYITIRNSCIAYSPTGNAGLGKIPTGNLPDEIAKELMDFARDFLLSQHPPEQA